MSNKITISNSLEHIMLYGYFQHAFEFYLHHIKGRDVADIQVVEMKEVFANVRSRLRVGTYLKPNILDSSRKYPLIVDFSSEERFWFDKLIKFKFSFLIKKTASYYKNRKLLMPVVLYYDLISNLRTERAIEFLRTEFLKKKQN